MTLPQQPSAARPQPLALVPSFAPALADDLGKEETEKNQEKDQEKDQEVEPPRSHIVRLQTESRLWQKDRQEQVQRAAEGALDFLAKHNKMPSAVALTVSILCTDEQCMRRLNRRFRNKDTACDQLAFPASSLPASSLPTASSLSFCNGDDGFLGDIALGYEGLQRTIEQHRLDALAHCAHMTIHGVLHLAGLTHDGDEERRVMEKAEETILAQLGFVDLHPIAQR